MVEMMELREILRRADARSLVLGDELCAGTEAASALSIVGAGVVHLRHRGAVFLLATHLHELTELASIRSLRGVHAFHMAVRCSGDGGGDKHLVFDRMLLPGKGMATYGLEVCRGLDMDVEFLATADVIRREVLGVPEDVVRPKASRYNSGVFVDTCGLCGKRADHVHHVQFQADADARGFVGHIHKNRASNLVPLCEACHDDVHHGKVVLDGFKQTDKGVRLLLKTEEVHDADNSDYMSSLSLGPAGPFDRFRLSCSKQRPATD